jgi:hypothetical protein
MKALLLCIAMSEVCFAAQRPGVCKLEAEPDRGPALIFGKDYKVPDLEVLVLDKHTGKPLTPKAVDIFYLWDWFEYPATDHPMGAWDREREIIQCAEFSAERIIIPSYTVTPRGWYNGRRVRWPWSRQPRFKHLEINVYLPQCTVPRVTLEPADLKRYEKNQAVWRVSCDSTVEIAFQAKRR